MATLIQIRRDTLENWTAVNPILRSGEISFVTNENKFKVGDGVETWTNLPYLQADAFIDSVQLGVDTTGDYVKQIEGTVDHIIVSASGGESASVVLSLPQSISTTSTPTFLGATLGGTQIGVSSSATIDTVSGDLVLSSESGSISFEGYIDLESGKVIKFDGVEVLSSTEYTGNSATSTKLSTAKTIALGGDLSGSASFDGSASISINATIQPDSVSLGTDTTGNYVSGISGTENEIEVTGSGSENATVTIGLPETINANTTGSAATLTNSRVISLSGDVSGSVTFDGSASVDISTQIQPNSVSLGTDTTGNYVATASGGTGISVSGSGSEDSAITIDNTGVISLAGTASQISVSASNGDATLFLPSSVVFPGTVTLNANPTQSLQAATKQYVDEVAEGLRVKPAVEVSTTVSLDASYSNGTSGVGATLTANSNGAFPQIDGITLSSIVPGSNGVLVKNQSNSAHNGRYNLTQVGNGSTPWILTRCGLCDESDEIAGIYIFVKDGTLGEGTGWVAIVEDPSTFVIGTDAINFIQFSGAGTYTAGVGLALNGTEFSNAGVVSLQGTSNEVEVSASSGNITVSLPSTINANTTGSAATLTNSRTIELTGDVTGSASFSGAANASISATIAPNSVALGTDTTGNYIATVGGTDGVSISGSGSETAAITIANIDKGSSQNIFKNVAVSGQSDIVADSNNDTLTLAGGTGINLTTNAITDTLTVTNSGVTSISGTANEVQVSSSAGSVTINLPDTINANTTGSAAKLTTARTIALTGDVTGTVNFDGSASAGISSTLANSGVSTGTYGSASAVPTITVDAKGRTTSASTTPIAIAQSAVTNLTTDLAAKAPLASPTFTGTVTVPYPTNATDAATKQYVDEVAEGLQIQESVTTSTTANINLFSAPSVIDGITLTDNMRVLVKNQSNAAQNGIYSYSASANELIRSDDYDTAAEVQAGDFVFVSDGDSHKNTGWVQTNNVNTLGTDLIAWSQFSGAGTYTAGTGLQLDATVFSNTGVLSLTGTSNEVEVSASSGNITVSLPTTINSNTSGNAATATTLANSRTIALEGDLSGSASFDGSASVSINATIQPNSVALGTDTTGNYVTQVTGSGAGISVTGNGESASVVVSNTGVTSLAGTASQVSVSSSAGSVTLSLPSTINVNTSGNADTATQLATARTISFGGDLSGSALFNGGSNVTISATIQPDSVALGTDTTGNYVSGITGTANQITVAGSGSENSAVTLSLPSTINVNTSGNAATSTKLATARAITLTGDVTGTVNFDGSASAGISSTLANSGVSTGTYGSASAVPTITVDAKGRTTSASTTPIAIAQSAVTNLTTDLAAKAPLSSPTLTGTPAAPTAVVDTNTTQVATTAYVVGQGYLKSVTASSTYQPLDADLTSIAGLSGTSGILRKTASNTFSLDTSTFVNSLSGTTNEIEVSASTGAITLSLPNTINANTTGSAASLTTSRTIALSGDVSGSVTFDGSASANITTTIQPNSVVLGTDTTGNYVATATAGTGISVSGSGSENASITINNTGVTSLTGTANQISVSASNGSSTLSLPSAITFPGTVTLNSAPTQSLHAATKQYVDEVAEGLKTKPSVEVATTANLTSTYNNGTAGVGATLTANSNGAFPEIDGVTITSTTPGLNGVLVKNQTNPAHNGRYNLTQIGNGSTPWILTRCGLCDQSSEIPGMYVFVKDGTVGSGTGWVAVVDDPSTFIVGNDDIDYFQFSGAGTYAAGNGLALNGTEFSNTGVLSLSGTTNEVEVSASSGSVTISLPNTINANTTGSAATLTTSRTIELTGDVTGSATFNGGANASISATIAANSVALGTDTTGNYVANVTGTANQITVAGSGSENSAVTLSLPSTINVNTSGNAATSTKLATARAITLTGDVTGTVNFDGSASAGIAATLANSGVSAGTYRSLTVNAKGLVTGGTNPTTLSGYGITDALSNGSTSTQSGYFGNIFLYDDSTPSHYLGITNSANLTAERTLSLNVNDANRAVSLSGDLTVSSAATVSGTNTGDQTITLTGDVTGTGTGSFATTIANTAVTPGSYGSASAVPTFTVDSKGRLTAASNTTIAIAQSAVTNLATDLAAKANLASPTFTGTLTAPTVLLTTADTATTATHYMVETGTDGIIRPKTLANVRTEIITTAAVNSAAATTVGTITSGVWNGSSISTTYTDAKVTSVNGSTGAITGLATLASPTFTGTVVFPSTTSIGNVSNTEISYLDGVTSAIQTQLNAKANIASPALTGTPTAPTAATGTSTTQVATTAFVQDAVKKVVIDTKTASYTLILADAGETIEMNVATDNNLTIPLNSSVAFPIGTTIDVIQYGAGQTTIVPTGGVTLRSKDSALKITGQYSGATLYKRGTDEWVIVGDLTA